MEVNLYRFTCMVFFVQAAGMNREVFVTMPETCFNSKSWTS